MLILRIYINLYMFWATMCQWSGERIVFMRHLVLVILCGWLFRMEGAPYNIPYIKNKHSMNKLFTKLALFTRSMNVIRNSAGEIMESTSFSSGSLLWYHLYQNKESQLWQLGVQKTANILAHYIVHSIKHSVFLLSGY